MKTPFFADKSGLRKQVEVKLHVCLSLHLISGEIQFEFNSISDYKFECFTLAAVEGLFPKHVCEIIGFLM